MYAGMLLLAVLAPAPLSAAAQPYGPPDVELPLPDENPFGVDLFIGGGCWSGGGIRFPDGSVLTAIVGSWTNPFDIVYRKPFYETETFRSSLFAGTRAGVTGEWYLGHGFSTSLELGAPFVTRVVLFWYPYRGITLSMACNLFPAWLQSGWTFSP